jgi:hypothetical protein
MRAVAIKAEGLIAIMAEDPKFAFGPSLPFEPCEECITNTARMFAVLLPVTIQMVQGQELDMRLTTAGTHTTIDINGFTSDLQANLFSLLYFSVMIRLVVCSLFR